MISWNLLNRLSLIFAILCFALNTAAQLKCNLKHYSTEDGLSHDRVLCMTKDSEGFMWFGTWDGINRFDGHNFIAYKARPGDSSSLKNNKIRNIIEDKLGYLWVKTYDNEVYRFDKRTEKFLAIPGTEVRSRFKNILINKIVPVSNGDTWLVTDKHGLLCAVGSKSLNPPVTVQYAEALGGEYNICSNDIRFLFEDSRQRLWIGTSNGVACLVKRGEKYTSLIFENQLPYFSRESNFTCITENNGIIYLGTANGRLLCYQVNSNRFHAVDVSAGIAINDLCFSKSNILYASTQGRGLAIINPANFSIKYQGIYNGDKYNSLFEDQAGLLWIEPEKTGVIKYDPRNSSFKLFTQKTDANISGPHTNYNVINGSNGIVWVSMRGGGFGYYDAGKDEISYFYDEPGSLNQQFSNIITALYVDASGILWLSGYEGSIYRAIFQPDNFTHHLLVKNPKIKLRTR